MPLGSDRRNFELPAEPSFSILALPPSFLDDLWRPEHFLLAAAAKYVPVVWMNPPHTRSTFSGRRPPSHLKSHPPPDIVVYTPPPWLPHLYRPQWVRRELFRRRIGRAIACLEPAARSRIVLSLWRPWSLAGIELKRFALTTYHATDLFADWGMDEQSEFDLLEEVGHTFASSNRIFERCSQRASHCDLLPNGVDYDLFSTPAQLPADLASIRQPRLVYAGVIKIQLDLELMANIAERLPHCSVVLVGPVTADAEKMHGLMRLRQLPNAYLLGPKSVAELPAYLQHADVGLMPYQLSNYTNHISPMKLNEYLAAGTPSVGSPIEPFLGSGNLLDLASGVDEWVSAIEKRLGQLPRDDADVERRQAAARRFDWDEIARIYLTILSQRLQA